MGRERITSLLVVDDNEDDREFLRLAIAEVEGERVRVTTANDGLEGVDRLVRLCREGASPDLAIVDLKMPRMDGRAFVRRVRAQTGTSKLPVLVVSSSDDVDGVDSCYAAGCNAYFSKPMDFDGLVELVRGLSTHWLHCARLPST